MKRKIAYTMLYSGLLCVLVAMGGFIKVAAQNYTSQYYVHLFNSLIDNTAIGSTTPNTARFTYDSVGSNSTSPTTQGGYTMWNLTGGTGETDFVNLQGSGAGGWWYYNGFGTLVAHLTPTSFFLPGITLATAPSLCTVGQSSRGIDVNGNAAGCLGSSALSANGYEVYPSGHIHEWGHTGTIADGGGGTGFTFPLAFPHAAFSVTAVGDFASGGSRVISTHSLSTSGFTLQSDGSGEGAYWQADGW